MSSIGTKLVASILISGDPNVLATLNLREDFFKPGELDAYRYLRDHALKYGVLPQPETLVQEVGCDDLPYTKESPLYFASELRKRYLGDGFHKGMLEAKQIMVEKSDPESAIKHMTNVLGTLSFGGYGTSMMDFREAGPLVLKTYSDKFKAPDDVGIKLGWPYFDGMSGGLLGGDLVSLVGRPAMGKTFKVLHTAMYAWWAQHKRVLLVSMEMNLPSIFQRMAAMHTHLSLTHLKTATLSTASYKKLKGGLTEVAGAQSPFWVMDGNLTATVEELWIQCLQMKPDYVVIDGAYLLGHPNKRLNRFERVAENTRSLKSELATRLDIPVSCSWQFNREAAKKAKKKNSDDKGGLEDIGFADEIGQLSSLVLGIFEHESVETMKRRRIDVLKGRNGETGFFLINWDFHSMNFSEYVETPLEQLQFI